LTGERGQQFPRAKSFQSTGEKKKEGRSHPVEKKEVKSKGERKRRWGDFLVSLAGNIEKKKKTTTRMRQR